MSVNNSNCRSRHSHRLGFEALEDRRLLALNLFVDFGDNFPGGTLMTTQAALRDVADDPTPADKILGPTLNDSAGGFSAATQLNIVAQAFTALERTQMMAVVERTYSMLDVNVLELTAAFQLTPDGRNVAAATSMADVVTTLRAGTTAWRDAYVFVGTFIVDPGGVNEQTYGPDGGGTSPKTPTLGENSDLAAASNIHDDVAVVYSDGGISNNTLNNIAHEAGHLLGVQHAITNPVISVTTNLFHQAEIMSYRNTNNTTSSMFTRYPMIRGDGNSPGFSIDATIDAAARTITRAAGDFTTEGLSVGQEIRISRAGVNNGVFTIQSMTASVLTLTADGVLTDDAQDIRITWGPLNYDDLAARNGEVTIYDQMRMDPNILADPDLTFVSGTGAHDIITITRNGANADVEIQAFADAAYTTAITVPGEADTTYSYSIPLTNTILVYAGDSNDRIVIDADLGVNVRIDGMLGTDSLVVNGNSVPNGIYTPNADADTGVDLVADFGGTLAFGGNSIVFDNFEAAGSRITVEDVTSMTVRTPSSDDVLVIDSLAAGTNRISGSSDGVAMVPLEFSNITSFIVDAASNDGFGGDDTIDLNSTLNAAGLQNLTIDTGGGSDIDQFVINVSNISLPVAGGLFSWNGGAGGIDTLDFTTALSGDVTYTPTVPGDPSQGTLTVGGDEISFAGLEFVTPVAPEISSPGVSISSASINEAGDVTVSGSFIDPGSLSTHSVNVDWGNGESTFVGLSPGDRSFSVTYPYADDHPLTGTASDSFSILVTVTDNDILTDDDTTAVIVNNVAPTIDTISLGSDSIDESESVTISGTFSDPALGVSTETFTGTALWSDGVSTPVTVDGTAGTFSTSRTFLDDHPLTGTPSDTFTVDITIDDDDLGSSDAQTSPILTVNNVDPVIVDLFSDATFDDKAEENEPVLISGSFTDVGVLDTHTAEVDWGDGTGTEMVTVIQGAGAGTFSGTHSYDAGGIYTITVTLTDDDTGDDISMTTAVVTGVGVNEGVLYVIGSSANDEVSINHFRGGKQVKVHASFIPEDFRTFETSTIDKVISWLCEGDDELTISNRVRLPAIIHGGGGHDKLHAGGGPTVLLGDAGMDTLIGQGGRNILIGGSGSDRLVGGNQDDVLIGGSTSLDEDDTALMDLAMAWDANDTYENRVDAIEDLLSSGMLTVFDDLDLDKLTGSSGRDLFFDGLGDVLTDVKRNEIVI